MSAPYRVLLVATGLALALTAWWSVTHAADRPRFSAGFGSAASPATRRFWGAVTGVLAIAAAILAIVL